MRTFIIGLMASIIAGIILWMFEPHVRPWVLSLIKGKRTGVEAIMRYRVMKRAASGGVDPVGDARKVHSDDDICFQVRLERAGSLYVIHVNVDGSLKWLNPGRNNKPQTARAGEWLRVPETLNQWIALDYDLTPERFLVLHVPTANEWTLAGTVYPQGITSADGFLTVSREAADRFNTFINSHAVPLSSNRVMDEGTVSYDLVSPAFESQITYYRLTLQHEN